MEFLRHLDIGQNKFAQNVGLSDGFVNNMGENISSKSLNKILLVYPNLNKDWLLYGKGDMIINEKNNISNNGDNNTNINNNGGNITISHNEFSGMIELQKELNKRLETSQKQISDLIEIIKKK